ncbi:MAG: hypothetical protein CVU48_01055 [Candidatus Cloacimonetes bacterium HGW-Cloacimonetes-1]|jgi:lipoate-protein ligase A|nr:MAG: hypothetical protein CVU48_01055 [Candidatus Cloacimonetes bacterium HGW-Cloacimonetes-1]
MITLNGYNLPDLALIEYAKSASKDKINHPDSEFRYMVFKPSRTTVVLGQSNTIEKSVNVQRCFEDNVEVMKRPSGGEAVLISPHTLIISFCILDSKLPRSSDIFSFALGCILTALAANGVTNAEFRGISDIAIEGKKILGCAIYRRPGMVLYHGVLNVSESPQNIGYYLLHPTKEPDYRVHRNHESFVTSLFQEGYHINMDILKQSIQSALAETYTYY